MAWRAENREPSHAFTVNRPCGCVSGILDWSGWPLAEAMQLISSQMEKMYPGSTVERVSERDMFKRERRCPVHPYTPPSPPPPAPDCDFCRDQPPLGFTCNTCRRSGKKA
ncbi:hypothetical protein GCM10010505_72000 [Kitasatospora aburaviensis]